MYALYALFLCCAVAALDANKDIYSVQNDEVTVGTIGYLGEATIDKSSDVS